MPDYIYLLENRLSQNQQNALRVVRDAARDAQMTVFLTGSAVRDLTSGSSVRELEFSVQGDIRKLESSFQGEGIEIWGEESASRTIYLCFPGAVRVEVSSTKIASYPQPGKPVYHWSSIQEDLRHRDFTVNAMALSLNEGSYGLLMDPLNGVADIEARTLRLVSNYGFLENPILLPRVIRLKTRLGWELDEKTAQRYENAKAEGVIAQVSDWSRSLELEDVGHEEDALRVLKALEAEGWMQHLFAAWTSEKADIAGLERLHETLVKLQMQGVNPDTSAAAMEFLTAKMDPKDLESLKNSLVRKGFVTKWNSLGAMAKQFSHVLLSKDNATPSATWKLFTSYDPEAVLWLALTNKSAAVEEKYRNFFTTWPEIKQKVPYALMLEMRIVPEMEGYQDLVQKIFLELIDGRLNTTEEMREFLKPYSPPAPPPPVTIKRSRGGRKAMAELKIKDEEEEEEGSEDEDEEDLDLTEEADFDSDEDVEISHMADSGDENRDEDEDDEDEDEAPRATPPAKKEKAAAHPPAEKHTKKVAEKHPEPQAEHKPSTSAPKAEPPAKKEEAKGKEVHGAEKKAAHPPAKGSEPAKSAPAAHAPAAHKAEKHPEPKKAEHAKHVAEKKHEAPHKAEPAKKKEPAKHEVKHEVKHHEAKHEVHEAKKAAAKPELKKQVKPASKPAHGAPVKPAAKKAVAVKSPAKSAHKAAPTPSKTAAKPKKK